MSELFNLIFSTTDLNKNSTELTPELLEKTFKKIEQDKGGPDQFIRAPKPEIPEGAELVDVEFIQHGGYCWGFREIWKVKKDG